MKKFLQKTYTWLVMLVAMFAMSTSAMAETVVFNNFTYSNFTTNGYKFVVGNVQVEPQAWCWNEDNNWEMWEVGEDYRYTYAYLKISILDDNYSITKVKIGGVTPAGAISSFVEYDNRGVMSVNGSYAEWNGNAKELYFGTTYSSTIYGNYVEVTYEAAAASTTFTFNSTSIDDGDVYTQSVLGLTLNHTGALSFAAGKSVSDITVNGTPMDAETYVLFNSGQTWINYTFSEDGANTIVIPEGVFENASGKTNEALTINFTINLPFFTMSAAEWTTFSGSSAWKMPAGYVGYIASDIKNGQVVLTRKFEAGADIMGGYPVIINGPAADKVIIASGSSSSGDSQFLYANNNDYAQTYNASDMWGSMQKVAESADYTNCYVYKLSYDNAGKNLGFYWDSADGRSINCQPHKAFLVVPVSKLGAASNGLKIRFAEDEVTGINAVATESNDAIYNLQGQRVNATAAGVYVKNGKKFIVK